MAHTPLLDTGPRKHKCPNCGKKSYVRCIDNKNGGYLPDKFGRCDREIECAYELYPSKGEMFDNGVIWKPEHNTVTIPLPTVFYPKDVLTATLADYDKNTFIQNLLNNDLYPFDLADVEKVISLYYLGSVSQGYRAGATTFPYIDINKNVRAIQAKNFDERNHTISTDFIHSIIENEFVKNLLPIPDWLEKYKSNEKKVSCLFGEHNLNKFPSNKIALVEAPKTAIYGTLYYGFPDNPDNLLWLAVYNLSSLNYEKCKALKGREVILFPDLSKNGKAFDLWSQQALELSDRMPGTSFTVDDLLEKNASDEHRKKGQDLADFLIRFDWRITRSGYKNFSTPDPKYIETSIVPDIEESQPKTVTTVYGNAEPEVITKENGISENQAVISQEEFDSLISDLDCGATWDFIIKRDKWKQFESEKQLRMHFNGLLQKHITPLPQGKKREFLNTRLQSGHTKDGVRSLFPMLSNM